MSNGGNKPKPNSSPGKGYLGDIAHFVPVEAVTFYTGATAVLWQQYARDLTREEQMTVLGVVVLLCFMIIGLVLYVVHRERRIGRYVIPLAAFLLWGFNINQSEIMRVFDITSPMWSGLAAIGLMAFTFIAPLISGKYAIKEVT